MHQPLYVQTRFSIASGSSIFERSAGIWVTPAINAWHDMSYPEKIAKVVLRVWRSDAMVKVESAMWLIVRVIRFTWAASRCDTAAVMPEGK